MEIESPEPSPLAGSSAVTTQELGDEISRVAGHLAAATCRWLLLVADFDKREGWADDGIASCAYWLSWRCGIAPGTAREQVRVARRLTVLPVITGRFATGELSYAKVRAITRIATPDTEAQLIDFALHATASQLEDMVREFKSCERRARATDERRRKRRYLRHRYDADGCMIITVRLAPEDGAVVLDQLEDLVRLDGLDEVVAAEDADAKTRPVDVSAETADATPEPDTEPDNTTEPLPGEQARADALVAMARRAATTLDDDASVAHDRAHLLIHVDADTLFGLAEGRSHLEHGPTLARSTVCELGCDATMAVLVEDGKGNPLHLGDTTPTVSRRQKRALLARDKGCRFPGCAARRYLHAHHIVHWIHGGPTCVANLALLCGRHHRAVHRRGFGVTGTNGELTFTRPDGTIIQPAPTQHGEADAIMLENQRLDINITAETTRSLSNGEPYDHAAVCDALLCILHPELMRPKWLNVPAETAA